MLFDRRARCSRADADAARGAAEKFYGSLGSRWQDNRDLIVSLCFLDSHSASQHDVTL